MNYILFIFTLFAFFSLTIVGRVCSSVAEDVNLTLHQKWSQFKAVYKKTYSNFNDEQTRFDFKNFIFMIIFILKNFFN